MSSGSEHALKGILGVDCKGSKLGKPYSNLLEKNVQRKVTLDPSKRTISLMSSLSPFPLGFVSVLNHGPHRHDSMFNVIKKQCQKS